MLREAVVGALILVIGCTRAETLRTNTGGSVERRARSSDGPKAPSALPGWVKTADLGHAADAADCLDYPVEAAGVVAPARTFLNAHSREFLKSKGLLRQDYVSNLRRAIDTWAIGFADSIDPEAGAIFTADIQEVTKAPDAQTNVGKSATDLTPAWAQLNGKITLPYVGSRQRCSVAEAATKAPSTESGVKECQNAIHMETASCKEKCEACGRCGDLIEYLDGTYYNRLKGNERTASHEGWEGWALKQYGGKSDIIH